MYTGTVLQESVSGWTTLTEGNKKIVTLWSKMMASNFSDAPKNPVQLEYDVKPRLIKCVLTYF